MFFFLALCALIIASYGLLKRNHRKEGHKEMGGLLVQDVHEEFALFYVASEIQYAYNSLPSSLMQIANGNIDGRTQQSLLVALSSFISYRSGRDRTIEDYLPAVKECKILLRTEINTNDSTLALRRWVRKEATEETPEITENEISRRVTEIASHIRSDDRIARSMQTTLVKDSIMHLFTVKFGQPFDQYTEKLSAAAYTSMQET